MDDRGDVIVSAWVVARGAEFVWDIMFKRSVQQQLLSHHLGRRQGKGGKLNLFGKAILVLDRLAEPDSLAGIRELDLSHNGICEIQNMEQFANVEFLNLAHNRIVDHQELLKLRRLPRLDSLYLKGNPFLREKMTPNVLAFLLSLNTDVELLSADLTALLSTLCAKALQNYCYSHYLRRIENHIELINNYQLDDSFLSPDYAIFPKIKKLFEESTRELSIKRQLIDSMDERCFQDEGVLGQYMKARVEEVENERSEIIKKVYEREQLLRNLRATYNSRVVPRKIIPRAMNGTVVVGYFSPPKLKESRKQPKMRSGISGTKGRRRDQVQNSPKKLSDSVEWREGYQEQVLTNALIKMNPLYHLLHSPLPSLKAHEKELLIQNLTLHLKEKMRELHKLEKREQEYSRAKAELNDLQEHLREMSTEFKNDQNKANEKLKRLSNICQEESERVENLCQQLTSTQEELQSLKEQNERMKNENAQLREKMALYEAQEDLEEAVRAHFANNLKQRYFRMLTKKAYHLSQLALLRRLNTAIDSKEIKHKYFQDIVYHTHLSRHERQAMQDRRRKSFAELIGIMRQDYQNMKKQEALTQCISIRSKKELLQGLASNHAKQSALNQRFSAARNTLQKNLKFKIFSIFKQELELAKQSAQNELLAKESCLISLRKSFRVWQRYLSAHRDRMAQCQELVVKANKRHYLGILVSRATRELTFLASQQATADFLAKVRKINGYLSFTRTTSATLLRRALKARKIQLIRQHQYLFWFMSTIRDCRVRKRIVVERELHRRRQEEQEKAQAQLAEQEAKGSRRIAFGNLIKAVAAKVVKKILVREKESMNLMELKQQRIYRHFLCSLRSNCTANFKIAVKSELLRRSPVISEKFKHFFSCLTIKQSKITKFREKSGATRLLKCFYRWKFYNSWCRMESYKQMYEQLEPEISHVSLLQRQVAAEKELLLREIEEKDQAAREWQRKCQDYEFVLHSKDLKYEKLRDIYADLVSQQEIRELTKPKERTEEEAIYLKYLPQELKTPATKYSFTRTAEKDDYLRNRGFQAEAGKESEKGSYLAGVAGRGDFLSSFKRF